MERVIELLQQTGALLPNDHFVGTSGLHFDTYINKDALFPHTKETAEIGTLFAEKIKDLDVEVIAAPAMGGIILSQWTAYYLSQIKNKEIFGIYAEKKNGELQFTRGYDAYLPGKKVAVIEDLTTTGGSLKKVIDLARSAGADVIAASVMVNKDPVNVTSEFFGVPFLPLAEYPVKTYASDTCELCKQGIPVNTSIGHGKEFVESKK